MQHLLGAHYFLGYSRLCVGLETFQLTWMWLVMHLYAPLPLHCCLKMHDLRSWSECRPWRLVRYCLETWIEDYGGHGSTLLENVGLVLYDGTAFCASDRIHKPEQPGAVFEEHRSLTPRI